MALGSLQTDHKVTMQYASPVTRVFYPMMFRLLSANTRILTLNSYRKGGYFAFYLLLMIIKFKQ